MNWWTQEYSIYDVWWLEEWLNDWFFVIALALFAVELIRYAIKKQCSKGLLGDSVANFVTLTLFYLLSALIALTYIGIFLSVYEHFRVVELPVSIWTLLCALVLADLAYYWEHRFLHSNGFAWATHSVHHSSPYYNISVAYRHGPLDWLFPLFFHLPLAVLGFHPFIIFLAEVMVQLYQTLLHTESVKKLPRPIEAIFNTPSHHRVHHATNRAYLDKNYGGILIIWDRLFGTFSEEKEKVRYGIYPAIGSINPIRVFFGGYIKLAKQCIQAPNWTYRWQLLVRSPKWAWEREKRHATKD